jgi:hypothetical protein
MPADHSHSRPRHRSNANQCAIYMRHVRCSVLVQHRAAAGVQATFGRMQDGLNEAFLGVVMG